MSPKNRYYTFIKVHKVLDVLKELPELSYSKKYDILNTLVQENYKAREINFALSLFRSKFIRKDCQINFSIVNILKSYCKARKEQK